MEHTFGSRALYLQEHVRRSTDLHASVHWAKDRQRRWAARTGLSGIRACADLARLSLGNGILLPPRLVKQAIKYKARGPAGRYNCSLDPSDAHKVWVYLQSHSSCPCCVFPTHDPGWHGSGWLGSHTCQKRRSQPYISKSTAANTPQLLFHMLDHSQLKARFPSRTAIGLSA